MAPKVSTHVRRMIANPIAYGRVHSRFQFPRSLILHLILNLVPRACDPWEGNEGSGIIRCRKPGILAKIELRIHFNGQSDSSLKRIIPEPSFPSQGSQARGTRLTLFYDYTFNSRD